MTDPYYHQQDPQHGYGQAPGQIPGYGYYSQPDAQGYGYPAQNQPVNYGGYGALPGQGYPMAAPYGYDPMSGLPLSDKSKVAAGLLQLFLGGFGAGRFYLGYTGIAVTQLSLYLIGFLLSFVLIGLPILVGVGVWALIDAIMIFTGSVKDPQGRVLRS